MERGEKKKNPTEFLDPGKIHPAGEKFPGIFLLTSLWWSEESLGIPQKIPAHPNDPGKAKVSWWVFHG